jgi:Cation transporter/ATPase, N-terminus
VSLARLDRDCDDDRMAPTVAARDVAKPNWLSLTLTSAGIDTADHVLANLDSCRDGLSSAEARRRLDIAGPNALRSHGARPLAVLARQLQEAACRAEKLCLISLALDTPVHVTVDVVAKQPEVAALT